MDREGLQASLDELRGQRREAIERVELVDRLIAEIEDKLEEGD